MTVRRDGVVEGAERLAKVLHGVRNHPTLHNPATFHVDYAQPGRFIGSSVVAFSQFQQRQGVVVFLSRKCSH